MEFEIRVVGIVKSRWVSAKQAYDRAKSRLTFTIDRQDPHLSVPLLVCCDVAEWSLLLLVGLLLLALGLLVLGVVLSPFAYLSIYLGITYLNNPNTLVYGLGFLAICNVAIWCLWLLPESEIFKEKYGVNQEGAGMLIQQFYLLSLLALWLGGSVVAAVISLDAAVLCVAISRATYQILSFLWFLADLVGWYLILFAAIVSSLTFISVYRRSRMANQVWAGKERQARDKWGPHPTFPHQHCSSEDFQGMAARLPV